MSLKRFLNNRDVRAKFREEFPATRLQSKARLLAPPRTTNYMLVGTAFDYLVRFYLQRLNPDAKGKTWIAEEAVQMLGRGMVLYTEAQVNLMKAKRNYTRYLKDGR